MLRPLPVIPTVGQLGSAFSDPAARTAQLAIQARQQQNRRKVFNFGKTALLGAAAGATLAGLATSYWPGSANPLWGLAAAAFIGAPVGLLTGGFIGAANAISE